MTPASEGASLSREESLAKATRTWRTAAISLIIVASSLLLGILVFGESPIDAPSVSVCGAACGPSRMKLARRAVCECHPATESPVVSADRYGPGAAR